MVFAHDDSTIADLIQRIQVYAFPRRLRSKEFFVNFDPRNSGRCTRPQFSRALDTLGVKLTNTETELLAEHFRETGTRIQPPQDINYNKLCDAIDKVFNDGDISFKLGDDSLNQMNESMMRMSMTSFLPNEVEDEQRMDHIMHRLATLCSSRGIVFKYLFQEFERSLNPSPSNMNPRRGGKCTASQFKRVFPFKKEFSDDDIEYIMRRYLTEGGDIHFQSIHNDISEVLSPEPPPFPTSPLYLKPDPTKWDHQTLNPVKKIQSKVVERRIRLSDFFKDFDPLRKGFCTTGQLKTVLTVSNLEKEVDRNDFNHIVDVYSREDGMFCWKLFANDIDSAFSIPGLEKDPLASTKLPDATTTAPGRRNRMTLSSAQRQKINALEDKLRTRIRSRRILMKPSFKDMDKANKGLVTRNQFLGVMGRLGFEMDQEEVALLAGYYCDRGNHNDFNYVDFIKACDPPDEQEGVAMSQLNSPFQDQSPSKYFDGIKVHPLDRAFSPVLV
jgi:Ca2+-binding EF-hand superfamily protein